MGNTMTRARMRTLQDIFREFDERHVGYLDQAQFQALLRKLGLKDFAHYTIQESDKKIDFYNFMNITERMLHDVFESMDEDHDLRLNFDEAIATFLKMDTDIVSEERLVLYLKRIQQKHADIIHSDHYIDAEYLLSQPVWLSCLLEALFSPIHNAVSEVAKKKKTISIQEEPKMKEISTTKGGVVSSFKSTVPRFQQDKRSEPGSSECDNRSVASSKDSSKPSSSFLSKERKFQVQSTTNHIGPGAYDISRDISGSRSYASSFHSNTKRSTSDGLVKTNHHQRSQSPGPGSYETRKSESVTHRRTESFSFSKIPRDTIYSPSTKMFIRQKDDRRSLLGSPVLSHQRGQTSQKTQSALPSSPQPQPRTRPASASVLYSTSVSDFVLPLLSFVHATLVFVLIPCLSCFYPSSFYDYRGK
eukprot:TRINITY_DN11522_c0_g1_i3.p1 TRINITY_DN11522_c0_g1~~TRINITY_DN11522_c0_g1_i3.p1  ORF type:complete len:417 (+),score=64.72 TRINITY_DN11522_c0_g1_i3:53-1303(+)